MRFVCVLTLLAFAPLSGQDSLLRGLQAEKDGRLLEATDAFQNAAELNPADVLTRFHLAGAWLKLYFEAPDAVANQVYAHKAEAEYKRALEMFPGNLTARTSLALLTYRQAEQIADAQQKSQRLEEARRQYQGMFPSAVSGQEDFYALEMAAYTQWHQRFRDARLALGMKPEDPGPLPDARMRQDLQGKYGPLIEDGIARLTEALRNAPEDALAAKQMSLFLRDRAELRDTPQQYREEIAQADEWGRKGANAAPERVRVGGNVQAANLTMKVTPRYPPAAKENRIQGTVRFTTLIGKDGRVEDLQLVSGHPLLVPSAYDAVRQWVYKPTTLNGNPIEVLTAVDVNYTLTQ